MAEAEVSWGDLFAAGDQPPRAAWGKLVAELRTAATELEAGKKRDGLAPGLLPTLRALVAVNDYLLGSNVVRAEPRLGVPLAQLIAAIYQTQQKPPDRGGGSELSAGS